MLTNMINASDARRHTGQQQPIELEATQRKLDIAQATCGLARPLKELAALMSHLLHSQLVRFWACRVIRLPITLPLCESLLKITVLGRK